MTANSRLTIIITTSPVASNPDMFIISTVISSLSDFITNHHAHIIIVYDGFSLSETSQFKSSKISPEQSINYKQFITNSQSWIKQWYTSLTKPQTFQTQSHSSQIGPFQTSNVESCTSENKQLTFLTLSTRFGFALGVREAIKFVKTDFVLINQHGDSFSIFMLLKDWIFQKFNINLNSLLDLMQLHPHFFKYITFPASATRKYLDFPWKTRCLPNVTCSSFPTLDSFKLCTFCQTGLSSIDDKYPCKKPDHLFQFQSFQFARLFFWYDKPHIVLTKTYSQLFNKGVLKRGDFIEDVIGHKYLDDIKKGGLSVHEKYGMWILWNFDVSIRHLNGRRFMTDNDKGSLVSKNRIEWEKSRTFVEKNDDDEIGFQLFE